MAKTKGSRGISARACVARAMTWKLDSVEGVLAHDASIREVSLPQVMWEIHENHQTNGKHKKMLE